MMDSAAILISAWERSLGDRIFLPSRALDGTWFEPSGWEFPVSYQELSDVCDNPDLDLYFTPLRFTGGARTNLETGPRGVLFADLDNANSPTELPPSVLWQTSPGNLQAMWFLDEMMLDYGRWAALNKALTTYCGADKGGWMGSKVLRIPGSVNHKRGGHKGRVLYYDSFLSYNYVELEQMLGVENKLESDTDAKHPLPKGEPSYEWASIPYDVKYWMQYGEDKNQRWAKVDRSMVLWELFVSCKNAGLKPEVVFYLLKNIPINKWKHRPETLWRQILRAFDLAQ